MSALEDLTLDEVLTSAEGYGVGPEETAIGVQRWRKAALDFGAESMKADPVEFWKRASALDKETSAALRKAQDKAAVGLLSTLPLEQRKPFTDRYAEVGGDPTKMIDDQWMTKAASINALQEDPRFQIDRPAPVTLEADGKALATMALKSSGENGWKALVMPLKEGGKPFTLDIPRLNPEQLSKRAATAQKELDFLTKNREIEKEAFLASQSTGDPVFFQASTTISQGMKEKEQEIALLQSGDERAIATMEAQKQIKGDDAMMSQIADKSLWDRMKAGMMSASVNTARAVAMPFTDHDPFEGFEESLAQINKDTARSFLPTTGEKITSAAATSAGQMAVTILPAGAATRVAGGVVSELGMASSMAPASAGQEWSAMLGMAKEARGKGDEEGAKRIESMARWSALAQAAIDTGTEMMFGESAAAFKGGRAAAANLVKAPVKEAIEEGAAGLGERGLKQPLFYPEEKQQPLTEGLAIEMGAGGLAGGGMAAASTSADAVVRTIKKMATRPKAPITAPDPATAAVIDEIRREAEDWADLEPSVAPEEQAPTPPTDQRASATGAPEDLPTPGLTEPPITNEPTESTPEGAPAAEPTADGVPVQASTDEPVEPGPAGVQDGEQDVQPTGDDVAAQPVGTSPAPIIGGRVALSGGNKYHGDISGTIFDVKNDGAILEIIKDGTDYPVRVTVEDYPRQVFERPSTEEKSPKVVIPPVAEKPRSGMTLKEMRQHLNRPGQIMGYDEASIMAAQQGKGVPTGSTQQMAAQPVDTSPDDAALKQGLVVADVIAASKRQGGFLDVGLVIDGLHEAAVATWAKAKDFASWAADMLRQFGSKVKPVLVNLWNKVTALVRGMYSLTEKALSSGVIEGRSTQRGMVNLRRSKAQVFGQKTDQPTKGDSYKAAATLAKQVFFDGDQPVTESATKEAWDKVLGWGPADVGRLREAGRGTTASGGDSVAVVGQAQLQLYRYAAQLAGTGDPSLLTHILTNAPKWAQVSEAGEQMTIGEMAAQLGTRSYPNSATMQAAVATGVSRGEAEAAHLPADFVDAVDTAVRTTKLDEPAVRAVKGGAKDNKGKTLEERVQQILKTGSLKPLEDALIAAPAAQQQSPTWRRNLAVSYFTQMGLSPQQAAAAARLYDAEFTVRLQDALESAIEKVAKTRAPWQKKGLGEPKKRKMLSDLDKLRRAVRLGVADPNVEWHADLARVNGWKGFTPEQFKRLAEIDALLEDESVPAYKKAELKVEVADMVKRAGLPPKLLDYIGASYGIAGLTGLPTLTVQLSGPISLAYKFFNDLPINPVVATRSFIAAMDSFVATFRRAAKTEVYSHQVGEYLQGTLEPLKHLFERGIANWEKGGVSAPLGLFQIIVGAQRFAGHLMNSVDEASYAAGKIYAQSLFTARELKSLGWSRADAGNAVEDALRGRSGGYDRARAAGLSGPEATIVANEEFTRAVSGLDPLLDPSIETAAANESLGVIGRLGEDLKETDEGGLRRLVTWMIPAFNKQLAKGGASLIGARAWLGYFVIPFRAAMWASNYTAYGYVRAAFHRGFTRANKPSPWQQSFGTRAQERQRLIDATMGTAFMLAAWAMRGATGDDDPDKSEVKIFFTGRGPEDKVQRTAWLKRFAAYSMVIKVGKVYVPFNVQRAFEALGWQSAFAGALDDLDLNRQRKGAKLDESSELIGSYLGSLTMRSSFAGLSHDTGPRAVDITKSMQKSAAFAASSFIPWKGALGSVSRLLTDPPDTKTFEGVILSNIPFASLAGKPALNVFGDVVRDDTLAGKLYREGVPLVPRFPTDPQSRIVYDLVLKHGKGPSIVDRGDLSSYGAVTPEQLYNYAKVRGGMIKEEMVRNAAKLKAMDLEHYSDALEKISRKVNPKAAKAVGLKKMR